MARLLGDYPAAADVLTGARAAVPVSKREIAPYQAAALYVLAHRYNRPGKILEIGTALGYSAAVLALAAPKAGVITLNPKHGEYERAREHLAGFPNVGLRCLDSLSFREQYRGRPFWLVFVDGAHDYESIGEDCEYWDLLAPGGLLLFHDYSPEGSKRPSAEVYAMVNQFGRERGRGPDVLIVDSGSVGMAGWYKGARG